LSCSLCRRPSCADVQYVHYLELCFPPSTLARTTGLSLSGALHTSAWHRSSCTCRAAAGELPARESR
jgi:hypothetical protein